MLRVTVLAALAGLALRSLAAGAPPPAPAPPPDAHLAAARDALVVAQEHLRTAGAGKPDAYGDHRKLALELVNTALEQVEAGLRIAAEEAARRAKEAAPQQKRRRRR